LDVSRLQDGVEDESEQAIEKDLVIIGAGPAGFAAGLYAGRAMLKPLIIVGQAIGGQAGVTSTVENYPGFPEGIGGMDLSEKMMEQATRYGTEILYDQVISVDLAEYPFTLKTYGPTYTCKSVIVCTGASPRKLGVPGEAKYFGRGVSYCATCDGYFYKDRTVVVVGGGDAAVDEALYLTRLCREVIIVHRRDELRASAILQERAMANEKIRIVWDSVVEEILGQDTVDSVRLRNVKTEEKSVISCDGVFMYVGFVPTTELFKGQLELNEQGYIVTDQRQRTNIPGVFAAGDVQDPWFRQVIVAAGAGAAAAIEAERFLSERAFEEEQKKEGRGYTAQG
jgi:thioredoxin reductase (NADPH)